MKSIKNIILPAVALLIFSSCNKWLEEDPKTNSDLEKMAETEQGLNILAVGAYGSLQKLYNLNNNPGAVGTDEVMSTKLDQLQVRPIDEYKFTASNALFKNAWNRSYEAIQNANIVIARVQEAEITEPVRLKLMAEMRFVRAFVYFRMVQWFGDLPLITQETPGYDKTVTNVSRSPLREIYDLIASDLEFAASGSNLPATVRDGRVTSSAAKALLAKVYLTMGTAKQRSLTTGIVPGYKDLQLTPREYYRKSYDLTKDLIDSSLFSLEPVYGNLFLPEHKNKSREMIWEIQFSSQMNMGTSWSKMYGLLGSGGQVYTFNSMVGRRIYQPVPGLIGYYKRGDLRYSWNIKDHKINIKNPDNVPEGTAEQGSKRMTPLTSWAPATLNSRLANNTNLLEDIGCSKYRWGVNDDPEKFFLQNDMNTRYAYDNCPNNLPVLRYADVLLMHIEADLLLGDGTASSNAVQLMNTLLFRARGGRTEAAMLSGSATNNQGELVPGEAISATEKPYYLYDYTTATLTYDELKKERARELCFEYHRWNDLVRWGDLETAVNGRLHAENGDVKRSTMDPATHYLFPIPQSEIDISRLSQNPNYGASSGDI